jgi:excisionase family DNA binding protein
MTVVDAALALRVSRDAIRKAIARGVLAASLEDGPYGRRYVISQDELDRYRSENHRPGHRKERGE